MLVQGYSLELVETVLRWRDHRLGVWGVVFFGSGSHRRLPIELGRMGDGGGNSEERILSLEEQIRRVEEEIVERVEQQIERVEQQIERLEEQIDRCASDEERMLLRREKLQLMNEELQLRDEGAQLRDEEAQLRDEKARLQQEGRDLGTEYDWLGQKVVPPAPSSRAGVYTSSSSYERMWLPAKVEHWDVTNEIEEFLKIADKRKRVYGIFITTYTENGACMEKQEKYHINFILAEMRAFMKKKEPQSNFTFEPEFIILRKNEGGNDGIGSSEGASSSAMVDVYSRNPRADFVITLRKENALVIKVKNEDLKSDKDDPWHLHQVWADYSGRSGEGTCWCAVFGITRAHGERIIRCISQLYEYMVLCKVGYGVLTDARNCYLFKRDNDGCLKISTNIKASGEPPRTLAALSYLVHAAAVDNSEFGDPTRNGRLPVVHEGAPPEHSSESTDGDSNDRTFTARASQNTSSSGIRRSRRCRSGGATLDLEDVSAEDLNLKKAGGVISNEGWSGCVVHGRLHDQPVALKFAYFGTERAEAFLKEVVAYTKMEKLWGVFVPRLVGYGTTNNGRVVFVATELIDGVQLEEAVVTREVEAAALQALAAVHACGLLHGDVSSSNIMVVRGTKPTVRILDFGFSCVTSDKKLQKAERNRLRWLFPRMVE